MWPSHQPRSMKREEERAVERAGEQHDAERRPRSRRRAASRGTCSSRGRKARRTATSPTAKSAIAAAERGAGTPGTTDGTSAPTTLKATIASAEHGLRPRARARSPCGPTNGGSAASVITAAPTGSVAAPVTAIRPFGPRITPGVESPCTARSAAMSAKPPPTITVRAVLLACADRRERRPRRRSRRAR